MTRLIAYVGTYASGSGTQGGGVVGLEVSGDGQILRLLTRAPEPKNAGYLVYGSTTHTLYAVDERKTDGRGPVGRPAAVHALSVDPMTGALSWLNCSIAPGPMPTFLDYSAARGLLISASHGDFHHVEKVIKRADGSWVIEYLYDDSTVVVYPLAADGRVGAASDVHVFSGQGKDPNGSPQNGGHAQSSPHAHCAVIDPSGHYVLVCDKGTDRIEVFRLGLQLDHVSTLQFEEETAPRHLAFDPTTGLAFATLELSSELASLRFDPQAGTLSRLNVVSTVAPAYDGHNEPAEVRVHPAGNLIYVNNRGEDSLAWFRTDAEGNLERLGAVGLARSVHPGLAARSFAIDPSGTFMLVADRPAHLVRSYAVCRGPGALTSLAQVHVPDPACIAFVDLDEPRPDVATRHSP